jgi:glycosyltransferase involved in cell wall biosynthesis
MTEEALQIDFQPQPRGIAVVTSAPISAITDAGNYSAFQDLIDGYASSFGRVYVFSPSGDPVVKPEKNHRVTWHSGSKWLSPTNGLWWTVLSNRKEFRNIELVRTFGPRAGVVGKAVSKLTSSPHVSSSDDLVSNAWRDKTGWRAAPTKLVNRIGVLRADMLSATLDWELEYLSETGYENDLLLGAMGLATDIYTPVGLTDPDRHPVVLWAGPVSNNESISLIEEAAVTTKQMIENVEFVVVAQGHEVEQIKADVKKRELPITVAALDEVEPLVDLIGRAWACVTVPSRDFPHGLAMLALSAGIPLISTGELAEKHGFKNHLNYVEVDSDDHDGIAYGLQLLRRWSSWALRIGVAGQKLVEERYSTRTVALKEGEQLARIARGEELETLTPKAAKVLRDYVSPDTGKPLPFGIVDGAEETEAESPVEEDMYADPGFDLVAAALADISGSKPASSPEPEADSGSEDMGQDAISALFAANDADPEVPTAEPVDLSGGDMGQDAISALFAANDADPEVPAAEPVDLDGGDMGQDAISALFAANDPEPEASVAEPEPTESGDLDQDAISALFAASDPEPGAVTAEPEPAASGDLGQDDISALFAAANAAEPEPAESGDLDQDAISALFAANDPEPAAPTAEPETPITTPEPAASGDLGQDDISALFAANAAEPEPTATTPEPTASGDLGQDDISALFAANNDGDEPSAAAVPEPESPDQTEGEPDPELDPDSVEVEDAPYGNLPEVNMVQFNVEDGPTDPPYPADADDDVDQSLIDEMLEAKDEDPSI